MRTCDYPGCRRKHDSNGLCHSHAEQLRRHGTLSPIQPKLTRLERFWAKVDTSGDCWLWTGANRDAGGRYGGFMDGAKGVAAHRYSWTIHYGPIPDGMVVCHRCDVTKCVRPDHLFLGTQRDNVIDMHAKGRAVPPHGERAHLAKLTNGQVAAIRADTRPVPLIAAEYGVHVSTIYRVLRRSTWKLV